jgi:uroporphyrin-III C-methyltransferase
MTSKATQIGKVFLIGAGPGDPKLLTLKAAEALSESDVIIYDHLVNPEVLVHAGTGAELIYAGKRAGDHAKSQAEINRLLIQHALEGQIVSRLKGGDPFIFGRGGEEAEALAESGIDWEIIPGVSSGVAAAAYAGIPLTHRDYSSSVAFITGHRARNAKRETVMRAAAHADTVVVFMCAETITNIARDLVATGRPSSTPIAIVRWATYEHQQLFIGTLKDLISPEEGQFEFSIEPPAIAIIGEVVRLAPKLAWFGNEKLRHLRTSPDDAELIPA